MICSCLNQIWYSQYGVFEGQCFSWNSDQAIWGLGRAPLQDPIPHVNVSPSLSIYICRPYFRGAIKLRRVCCHLPVPSNHSNHNLMLPAAFLMSFPSFKSQVDSWLLHHFQWFRSSSLQLAVCQFGISFCLFAASWLLLAYPLLFPPRLQNTPFNLTLRDRGRRSTTK